MAGVDTFHVDTLGALIQTLRAHPNIIEKLNIASAYAPGVSVAGGIAIGDDAAAIPDGAGFLLFAAEGMIEGFIARDPWFAGYCAVMVNLSDMAAMGGRPIAIVDVVWTPEDSPITREIWAGLRAASAAYNVPIVGGHTTRFAKDRTPLLAAAVLGRARRLISSFTAEPGDVMLMAVDLRAVYRGEGTLFWNASTDAPSQRLRDDLAVLAEISEAELVTSGKDISNGGLLGTAAMLLATSRCGAIIDLDQVPKPPAVALDHWLLSFPSYGYLLTAKDDRAAEVIERFQQRGIACEAIGRIENGITLRLRLGGQDAEFAQITPAVVAEPSDLRPRTQ